MKPLDGYLGDLLRYQEFLETAKTDAISVSSNQLADFSSHLVTLGLKASSNARILAAVRGFHKFLLLENLRSDDPTVKLRPPRLGKRLPKRAGAGRRKH